MKRLRAVLLCLLLSAVLAGQSLAAGGLSESAEVQAQHGPWVVTTLQSASNTGQCTSLAVDSRGLVHISYYDSTEQKLMYTRQHRVGADIWWGVATVAAAEVGRTALALDENDNPYIGYQDISGAFDDLCWAWLPAGGTWKKACRGTTTINDGALVAAAARGGNIHLAWRNNASGDVEYASFEPVENPSWPITAAVVGAGGGDISLALRSDGIPRITYRRFSDMALVYARLIGTTWSEEVLDGSLENNAGDCNGLALDSNNEPRVAYLYEDYPEKQLRYIAYRGLIGNPWFAPTTLDRTLSGAVCDISLAAEGSGAPHIVYYNDGGVASQGTLHYTHKLPNGVWQYETIDGPASSCGMHSALALDADGRPHASYYCSGKLMYAYRLMPLYLPLALGD